MDAYLLDTTVLSIYLDPNHLHHVAKSQSLAALPTDSPRFVSAVALAELGFGTNLAALLGKGNLTTLDAMLVQARAYAVLDITHCSETELWSAGGWSFPAFALRPNFGAPVAGVFRL
ncbi:MAG: hypothetical protein ABJG26_06605, partial [Marinomonas sp.]